MSEFSFKKISDRHQIIICDNHQEKAEVGTIMDNVISTIECPTININGINIEITDELSERTLINFYDKLIKADNYYHSYDEYQSNEPIIACIIYKSRVHILSQHNTYLSTRSCSLYDLISYNYNEIEFINDTRYIDFKDFVSSVIKNHNYKIVLYKNL